MVFDSWREQLFFLIASDPRIIVDTGSCPWWVKPSGHEVGPSPSDTEVKDAF
jgi:hypothetical protein